MTLGMNLGEYLTMDLTYENEKRKSALKIESKNLLNMKIVVNYLNFVFHIEANKNKM